MDKYILLIGNKETNSQHASQQTFLVCLFQKKMKMSDSSNMSAVEASVLGQCLEFTSNIAKNKKSFFFNLKLSNGFIFNFCNTEKRNSLLDNNKQKKKPSPSTLARNKICMEKFIAKKKASAINSQ